MRSIQYPGWPKIFEKINRYSFLNEIYSINWLKYRVLIAEVE